MTSTIEEAFEVEGLLIDDKTGILTGDADPTAPGIIAPIGSYYMRTNGSHYRKTGALDNEWTLTDTAAGSVADQFQFVNRAGASENITIIITPTTYLTFFNRAGAAENIGII